MSFFKNSFGANTSLEPHPDIAGLLYIENGPKANYGEKEKSCTAKKSAVGLYTEFGGSGIVEPSLIDTTLGIGNVGEKLPYYPEYRSLSDGQRAAYWEFLSDPFKKAADIGCVFLFYYGLERRMLLGDMDEAVDVILRLRDVNDNGSFQSYSACAVIFSSIMNDRADLHEKFMDSLDKEYEFDFDSRLYLLSKLSLGLPLTMGDIMSMAKELGLSDRRLIRQCPELFAHVLEELIKLTWNTDKLYISGFFKEGDLEKCEKTECCLFANNSLGEHTAMLPEIISNKNFSKCMRDLLTVANENAKRLYSELKSDEKAPPEQKAPPIFEAEKEKEILRRLAMCGNSAQQRHYVLEELHIFYYRFRDTDEKYLQLSEDYCRKTIDNLEAMQDEIRKAAVKKINELHLPAENAETRIKRIKPFKEPVLAFQRLAIIQEKRGDLADAIKTCKAAVEYYKKYKVKEEAESFSARMEKLKAKELRNGSSATAKNPEGLCDMPEFE